VIYSIYKNILFFYFINTLFYFIIFYNSIFNLKQSQIWLAANFALSILVILNKIGTAPKGNFGPSRGSRFEENVSVVSKSRKFPNLKGCSDANCVFPEDKIQIFTYHLPQLKKDMQLRFQALLELQIPNWILDFFSFESMVMLGYLLDLIFICSL